MYGRRIILSKNLSSAQVRAHSVVRKEFRETLCREQKREQKGNKNEKITFMLRFTGKWMRDGSFHSLSIVCMVQNVTYKHDKLEGLEVAKLIWNSSIVSNPSDKNMENHKEGYSSMAMHLCLPTD